MITVQEMFRRATCGPFKTTGLAVDYNITEYDDAVWVTFQGTCFPKGALKWIDLLVDLDCRPIRFGKEWFSNGFLQAALSVKLKAIEVYISMKPIIYSGFSLGGAMASLFGEIHGHDRDKTITFGAPRTRWGIKTRTNKSITHYAILNDPIVHLAPALWGYYHPGKTIWLDWVDAPMFDEDIHKCSHRQYKGVLKRMGI